MTEMVGHGSDMSVRADAEGCARGTSNPRIPARGEFGTLGGRSQ